MQNFDYDVVAFAAHPDDIELTCGGTIRKLANYGYKIAFVDLTQGELGSRGSVETRKQESEAASKILGVHYRENLKLPDGALDGYACANPENDNSQLSKVVSAIRRLKPQIVLASYHKCRHPDHEAASRLVTRAVFFAGLTNYKISGGNKDENTALSVRQLLYYSTRFEFKPSFIVDISDVVEEKNKARLAYSSQLGLDSNSGPETLLSSPLTYQSLDVRDRYYGSMIGTSHGEPFQSRAALQVNDPVSFFKDVKPDRVMIFPE